MKHADHDERRDEDCADCRAEMEASIAEHIGSYHAERGYRESLELARRDLDMRDATASELMEAIQWLK